MSTRKIPKKFLEVWRVQKLSLVAVQ